MLELGTELRLMVRVGVRVKGYVYDLSLSHIYYIECIEVSHVIVECIRINHRPSSKRAREIGIAFAYQT